MFEKEKCKLIFIIEKIDDILAYRKRYNSIEAMLEDKMGWDASVMCIQQIGETLKNKLSHEFQDAYSNRLPIQEAYWARNHIAHDYENIDKRIVETIIKEELPKLKSEIESILKEL